MHKDIVHGEKADGAWLNTGWRDSAPATLRMVARSNHDGRKRDTGLVRIISPSIQSAKTLKDFSVWVAMDISALSYMGLRQIQVHWTRRTRP
jgi:hypothetical protein